MLQPLAIMEQTRHMAILSDLPHDCVLSVLTQVMSLSPRFKSANMRKNFPAVVDLLIRDLAALSCLSRAWNATIRTWALRNSDGVPGDRRVKVLFKHAYMPAARLEYDRLSMAAVMGLDKWEAIAQGNARLESQIRALGGLAGYAPAALRESWGLTWDDDAHKSEGRRGAQPLDFFEISLRISRGAIRAATAGDAAPASFIIDDKSLELQLPSDFQGVCQIDSPFAALPKALRAQMRAAGLVLAGVDTEAGP